MNNFDFYLENLNSAQNSEGALQQQADIYAESWKAAKAEIQAALEDIYTKLVNDDFFIDLANGFEKILEGVSGFIDGLGGVKELLLAISSIFMQNYAQKMPETLTSLKQGFLLTFGQGPNMMKEMQDENLNELEKILNDPNTSSLDKIRAEGLQKISKMQKEYALNASRMNEQDKLEYQQKLKNIKITYEEIAAKEKKDKVEQKTFESLKTKNSKVSKRNLEDIKEKREFWVEDNYKEIATKEKILDEKRKELENLKETSGINEYEQAFKEKSFFNSEEEKKEYGKSVKNLRDTSGIIELENTIKSIEGKLKILNKESKKLEAEAIENFPIFNSEQLKEQFNEYEKQMKAFYARDSLSGSISDRMEKLAKKSGMENADVDAIKREAQQYLLTIKENLSLTKDEMGVELIPNEEIQKFEEGLKNCGQDAEKLKEIFSNFGKTANASIGAATKDADIIAEDIKNKIEDNYKGSSEVFAEADKRGQEFNRKLIINETKGDLDTNIEVGAVKLSTAFTQAVSAAMMLSSAISSISNAITVFNDENATASEKIGALISSLSAVAFTAPSAINAVKSFASALNISTGVVGAIAIGISVAIGVITNYIKWEERQRQAVIDHAEEVIKENEELQENIKNIKSLSKEVENLAESYESAKEAGEDVSDSYENLIEKLDSVRENYEKIGISSTTLDMLDQAAAVALATGNWNEYYEIKRKADREANIASTKKAEAANASTEVLAKSKAQSENPSEFWKWALGWTPFVKSNNSFAYKAKDGTTVQTIGLKNIPENYTIPKEALATGLIGSDIFNSNNSLELALNMLNGKLQYNQIEKTAIRLHLEDPYLFTKDYEQLMEIAKKETNLEAKDEYQKILQDYNEIYTNYFQNLDILKANIGDTYIEKNDVEEIEFKNLDNYSKILSNLKQEYINELKMSEEDATKAAKDYLKTYSSSTNAAASYAFLEKFRNKLSDSKKYTKEEAQEEMDAFYSYFSNLSDEDKALALTMKLDYIDSVEEFENTLNNLKEFDVEVKLNVEDDLKTAKTLRDNLSSAMQNYKKQGYLTADQAYDLLQKDASYKKYLVQTEQGYALTTAAINDYNNALGEQGEALNELINPSIVGQEAIYNLTSELIQLENIFDNSDGSLKIFTDNLKDVSKEFVAGKKDAVNYLEKVKDLITELKGVERSDLQDLALFYKKVVPSIINNLTSFMAATREAFSAGTMNFEDYQSSIIATAEALNELSKKTNEAVAENVEGVARNAAGYWVATVNDENAKKRAAILNSNEINQKTLNDDLEQLKYFKELNNVASQYYDTLNQIFNEDFTLKIDVSQLEESKEGLQSFMADTKNAFQGLTNEFQRNAIIEAINNIETITDKSKEKITKYLDGTSETFAVTTMEDAKAVGQVVKLETTKIVNMANDIKRGLSLIGDLLEKVEINFGIEEKRDENGNITGISIVGEKSGFKTVKQQLTQEEYEKTLKVNPLLRGFSPSPLSSMPLTVEEFYKQVEEGKWPFIDKDQIYYDIEDPAVDKILYELSEIFNKYKGNSDNIILDDSGTAKKPVKYEAPDLEELKELDEDIERYHEINKELEDIEDNLNKIADAADEAFGTNRIELFDKEIEGYNQTIDAQQTKLSQVRKNKVIDKAEAEKYGFVIDEDTGRITNYTENMKAINQTYNNSIDKINKNKLLIAEKQYQLDLLNQTDGNDAAKWALEDAIDLIEKENEKIQEAAEETRTKAIEAGETWEDTVDTEKESVEAIEDAMRSIRELNYEKLEYKLELRMDLNEDDQKNIEHQLNRISENDYTKSAERIALITQEGKLYSQVASIQEAHIKNLKEEYAAQKISQADFIEGIKKAKEEILNAEEQIRQGIETIGQELTNAFTLAAEKTNEISDKFDKITSFLDFYKDISAFINGESDYSTVQKILDAQIYNTKASIEKSQIDKAMWQRTLDELNAKLPGLSGVAKEETEEAIKTLETQIDEADSKIQSNLKNLATYAKEQFEAAIEEVYLDFQKTYLGDTFENVLEEISLKNQLQDELLTTTNKIYETNKLIRQAEKDINATTNARAKQAYNEYIAKVKQKQEQNELTQFELDLLSAEYEITKAQIALEEAQNAKDTVRLTRDAEGNFGYVYTANQDKIADAEQKLEDANNNYYNIALNKAKSTTEQIYKLEQTMFTKIKELKRDDYEDEEAYQEARQEIIDYYMDLIQQQNDLYYMATGAMKESSVQHDIDYDLKDIESAENVRDKVNEFTNDMDEKNREYQETIEWVSEKVEEDYGDQAKALENVKLKTDEYKEAAEKLAPELENNLTRAIDSATEAWQRYIEELERVIELSDEIMTENHNTQLSEIYSGDYAAGLQEYAEQGASFTDYDVIQLLQGRWNETGGANWKEDVDAFRKQGYTIVADWMDEFLSIKNGVKLEDIHALIDTYMASPYANWNDSFIQELLEIREKKMANGWYGVYETNAELEAIYKDKYPNKFDTGGYTGVWGPEGRLAMLHEKELVLNADDTRNILSSVEIIREISQMLSNNALQAALGLTSFNNEYNGLSSFAKDVLQQQVEIHADFPSVTDHNEIEMALNNLVNAASQYAYRN